jgi:putative transposase
VFAVKYRKNILTGKLNEDMLQLMFDIAKCKKFSIDTIQSDINHIHILIDAHPTSSAYEIAHILKQISTYRIYELHRQFLKTHFWNENTFWSDGYFVCSTGNASTETIRKYIEEQG